MRSLPLTANRFGIEPELTARLAQARARILRGAYHLQRTHLRGGEKDRMEDGAAALWHILRANFCRLPHHATWRVRNQSAERIHQ